MLQIQSSNVALSVEQTYPVATNAKVLVTPVEKGLMGTNLILRRVTILADVSTRPVDTHARQSVTETNRVNYVSNHARSNIAIRNAQNYATSLVLRVRNPAMSAASTKALARCLVQYPATSCHVLGVAIKSYIVGTNARPHAARSVRNLYFARFAPPRLSRPPRWITLWERATVMLI